MSRNESHVQAGRIKEASLRPEKWGTCGRLALLSLFSAALIQTGCNRESPDNNPDLTRFLKAREAVARELGEHSGLRMPAAAQALFEYQQRDKWSKATNTFAALQALAGRSGTAKPPSPFQAVADHVAQMRQQLGLPPQKGSALEGAPWHAIVDAHWAYVLSKTWRRETLDLITGTILKTVPPGAVFFGDSDLGRFAVARAVESADPENQFFVITQNQLADYTYCEYAGFLVRSNVAMPGPDDFNSAYSRSFLTPNRAGKAPVELLNAELAKILFDQNPGRRIYMEASWYVPQWAYDRAVPRGLVFELERQPVARLEQTAIESDRAFWSSICLRLVGDAIRPETSVKALCNFVERTYVLGELSGFKGNGKYVSDFSAQDWFGMARHATASLYQWHCIEAEEVGEKRRMLEESVLAYKQTFALNPLISRDFADLLSQVGRTNEVALILATCDKVMR